MKILSKRARNAMATKMVNMVGYYEDITPAALFKNHVDAALRQVEYRQKAKMPQTMRLLPFRQKFEKAEHTINQVGEDGMAFAAEITKTGKKTLQELQKKLGPLTLEDVRKEFKEHERYINHVKELIPPEEIVRILRKIELNDAYGRLA